MTTIQSKSLDRVGADRFRNAVGITLLAAFWPAVTVGGGPRLIVEHIDGTAYSADWVGSTDGGALAVTREGKVQAVPLDDLATVTFQERTTAAIAWPKGEGAADASTPFALFHLADGGTIPGRLVDPPGPGDALFAETALGEATALPFEHLAAVQLADAAGFTRADDVLRQIQADRPAAADVLITRDVEEVKTPYGRLESLRADKGSFSFGGESRSFSTDKIYAIVFAAGPSMSPKRFPLTVFLTNGAVFSGSLETADAGGLRVATSLGAASAVPLDQVARLEFRSDRVTPVSDLTPASQHVEGVLHRPWPVRMDRSVSAGPLSIDGKVFDRGIGVHSRTELVYELAGRFEKFVATIGIDDAVRPRGSVVFQVAGDGKILFDSGKVTGSDAPRDVIVAVRDVRSMTLLVDYADAVDVADQADWAGARLISPPVKQP